MSKKSDSIETVAKMCFDVETNNEELCLLLKDLDYKHFGRAFTQKKVTLAWSSNMKETKSRINKPKKGNPGSIFLSTNRLSAFSKDQLKEFVRDLLNKAYKDFGLKDNCGDISSDNLNKCFQNLSIVDKPIKFEVQFEMKDEIRKIELKNIVDPKLEELDPQPDIQILFKEYDNRFFNGILNRFKVKLEWSDRLTASTGITYDETPERPIIIRLSLKLLAYEKRSHLVETLLHEMIHAYTYIEDLDSNVSHGHHFHKIGEKIRAKCGAYITVYHDLLYNQTKYLKSVEKDRKEIRKDFEDKQTKNRS